MNILSSLQETAKNTDSVRLNPSTDIPWLSFGGQDDSTCPFKLSDMKKLFKLDCDNKNENVMSEPDEPIFADGRTKNCKRTET